MSIETNLRRRAGGAARAAFTLVEMLLTVALILLLSGAVIFNFASLQRGARLDEGVTQLESIFRYARAQAADTGRRVEVVFGNGPDRSATNAPAAAVPDQEAANSAVRVLWEPDPVGAPGTFVPLASAAPLLERLDDLVQAREAPQRSGGEDRLQTDAFLFESFPGTEDETNAPAGASGFAAEAGPPVTCYPDGSSDSAQIVLRSVDSEDTRRSVVTLSGVTGTLRHRTFAMMTDGARLRGTDRTSDESAMNEAPDQ